MSPAPAQWTPADEKQLRQLRQNGVSIERIAKTMDLSHSAVARKCRAMGLTNQTLHQVARSPKAALSDKRKTDKVHRAGKRHCRRCHRCATSRRLRVASPR